MILYAYSREQSDLLNVYTRYLINVYYENPIALYISLGVLTEIVGETNFIRKFTNIGESGGTNETTLIDNSTSESIQINRLIQTDAYLNQPHYVSLTTEHASIFKKRINVKIGSTSLFKCSSDTLKWSSASSLATYTEVTLYYCDSYISSRRDTSYYREPCTADYQYIPLFRALRDIGSLNISIESLSFRFSDWVYENDMHSQRAHSDNVEVLIPIRRVTRFNGAYFFCRIRINSHRLVYGYPEAIKTFDSESIIVRLYGTCSLINCYY